MVARAPCRCANATHPIQMLQLPAIQAEKGNSARARMHLHEGDLELQAIVRSARERAVIREHWIREDKAGHELTTAVDASDAFRLGAQSAFDVRCRRTWNGGSCATCTLR